MRWLLDTNACIRHLNGRAPALRNRLDGVRPANIFVCSVVKAELFSVSGRSTNPVLSLANERRFLDRFASSPFDDGCAERYSTSRTPLTGAGTPIGADDMMIAATALAYGVTLVTHNTAEFSRVGGLILEDWEV